MHTQTYIIQEGDTLGTICAKYGVSMNKILEINPHITDPNIIYVWNQLNVPATDLNRLSNDCPWMDIAEMELGEAEIPGSSHNPRILAYHATCTLKATSDEIPWCSAFVNWVMEHSGYPGTKSAAALSWKTWGRPLLEPQIGCIVVFRWKEWRGHVGFVAKIDEEHILVWGGNQGNMVSKKWYLRERVLTYRWPKGC